MMSKYPLLGMTLIELQSLVKRLGMPGFFILSKKGGNK